MIDFIRQAVLESFQSQVAKPRTKKGQSTLLDQGRKDLVKHGAPFNQGRPVGKSNAFFANEGQEEEIEEASTASAAVGAPGTFVGMNVDKENEEHKRKTKAMIQREHFAKIMEFRENISSIIKIERKKVLQENFNKILQANELREIIQDVILEAAEESQVHNSTALNYLDELLGNILPTIKADYEKLTSDKSQRDSFRAHLVNGVRNLMELASSGREDIDEQEEASEPFQKIMEKDVDINLDDEDKFIDVLGSKKEEEPEQDEPEDPEFDKFSIQGQDQAGALAAYETMNKVDTQIQKAYKLASGNFTNDQDAAIFYDYLLTNLKLHFDVFEDELSPVQEPTTPEYEKEKDDLDADPVSMDDQGVEEPGEDPEVLMYESWTDKVFNVLIKEQIEEEDMPLLVALAQKMEIDPSLPDNDFTDSLRGAMQEIGSDIDDQIASSIKDLMNKQNQNKI